MALGECTTESGTSAVLMQLFNEDTMNAPWGLESKFKLVDMALNFFDVDKLAASYSAIGKAFPKNRKPKPLTGTDFFQYIVTNGNFQKKPNALRVAQILKQMVADGLLIHSGYGRPSVGGLGDYYLYASMKWNLSRGQFLLARTLGPDFLYRLCAPGLVHITGTNSKGDVVAGTGIVIHPSYVLTCRHVISDMELDACQEFQGNKFSIRPDSIYRHPDVDIAILQVDQPTLVPLIGIKYQRPVVAQTVFTLGYPKLSGLRGKHPPRTAGYVGLSLSAV
ncbi:MAG: trypsin-like peptidase domain-containing protein, partial [Rhodospirillaceae bacterium]|nr:trypsin-like peptidase domain-containing protein [Rhodospirillaceae bacterium]MYB12037.1 trypsin-like peptidase domain-containing protein [Rhodospirillaceae bacterium]MYI50635.1 trypsin-like peptidase domain-containing protein [Rhodospirillaceae bacterium]